MLKIFTLYEAKRLFILTIKKLFIENSQFIFREINKLETNNFIDNFTWIIKLYFF